MTSLKVHEPSRQFALKDRGVQTLTTCDKWVCRRVHLPTPLSLPMSARTRAHVARQPDMYTISLSLSLSLYINIYIYIYSITYTSGWRPERAQCSCSPPQAASRLDYVVICICMCVHIYIYIYIIHNSNNNNTCINNIINNNNNTCIYIYIYIYIGRSRSSRSLDPRRASSTRMEEHKAPKWGIEYGCCFAESRLQALTKCSVISDCLK